LEEYQKFRQREVRLLSLASPSDRCWTFESPIWFALNYYSHHCSLPQNQVELLESASLDDRREVPGVFERDLVASEVQVQEPELLQRERG